MSNLLYNLAQPFSDTKQYTQGTIVVYNDRMYEMTASDYTPGAFNPEKFTERFLSEMMSGKLNCNLSKELTYRLMSQSHMVVSLEEFTKIKVITGTVRVYVYDFDCVNNVSGGSVIQDYQALGVDHGVIDISQHSGSVTFCVVAVSDGLGAVFTLK